MFYDIFESLCKEKGVTPTKVSREIGIAQQSISLWKKRGSTPSGTNLQKLADYFGVSVEYLLGSDQKEKPAVISDELTERDRRDIARNLEKMMNELESSGDLMFDGDPATPEAIESVRQAMAMALEYAKKVNKQKYTPKKYQRKNKDSKEEQNRENCDTKKEDKK